MKGKWLVPLDDDFHVVRADMNMWGALSVYFDDNLVGKKYFFFAAGEIFRFSVPPHVFVIKVKGFLWQKFSLYVDGAEAVLIDEVVSITDATEAPKVQSGNHKLMLVREDDISEKEEIVGYEEFPLDNTSGSDVVTMEHEVSKTVSNEIKIDSL